MGSGFKDFSAGDVLTASDVDGYLMRQGVMVFASASARNTALSGNLEEGMHAYLSDLDAVTYYDGSAWRYVFSQPTSFTPSWTNLSPGSGPTQNWAYQYRGNMLLVQGATTFGTGGSVSGTVSMTIPDSVTADAFSVGVAHYLEFGVGGELGMCNTSGSGSTSIAFQTAGLGVVNGSSPFSWGTAGDSIRCTIEIPVQ